MKTLLSILCLFLLTISAHAQTLVLKNGSKVTGKILSQDDKKVKIEIDGAPMTYYMDEIDNIGGEEEAKMETPPPADVPQEATAPVVTNNVPAAAVDGAKKALILKFIDVFGTRAAMTQNLQAMTENLPADNPDYQKIKKGINVDEIIERLVPVYDKYFTNDDLKDYIEFYASAKGKKLIDAISKVMRESVDVSAQYFQEKFPESANQP